MRFPFPRFPAEFEIPDAWWIEAGMPGFTRQGSAYRSSSVDMAALDDIEPLFRRVNTPRDWQGFRRTDLVKALRSFVAGDEIPPIDLLILPRLGDMTCRDPYSYRIIDGYHRFYASIAAGFEFVPATTRRVQ